MKKNTTYVLIVIVVCVLVALGVYYKVVDKNDIVENNSINQISKSDVKSTKIRLNEVTRSVFYAPQYVAINKGFFEKENIELEITTGQGADKVMTAVLANQSDIGLAGPEASIYVYNEGKEDYTEVFAQLTKTDGSFLVSKTNMSYRL